MPTFVEELVYYLENIRYPHQSANIVEVRDRLQAELKRDSGSRKLNKINSTTRHADFHALNPKKFQQLMDLFDQANKTAIKNGKLVEGIFVVDSLTEATLRSWIDSIVLEGCEMLLDDRGLLRQDVLSFLGLKTEEQELNQSNNLLRSYVQHMTEEITLKWNKENVGEVHSGEKTIARMSKDEKKKNEDANNKAVVFGSIQFFFTKYFNNPPYIASQVDQYLFRLACDIPAKCATELKALSMKIAPDIFKPALTAYILADLQKPSLVTNKVKLEFWIDTIYFSAGNGDCSSLEAFLDACATNSDWLKPLSLTKLAQHVSCQSLFTYYKKGWIVSDLKEPEEKKEAVNGKVSLDSIGEWINARDNNEIIEVIFQKYHREDKFASSDKETQAKEKNILLELGEAKFVDALLKSTEQFLKDLAGTIEKEIGKKGRLFEVIESIMNPEKYENINKARPSTFISNPKPATPQDPLVRNHSVNGKKL